MPGTSDCVDRAGGGRFAWQSFPITSFFRRWAEIVLQIATPPESRGENGYNLGDIL